MEKLIVLIMFFFPVSFVFAAPPYCAEGFGTELSNGTYDVSGATHNGFNTLTNGIQFIDVTTFTGTYYFSLNESGSLNEGTALYYWVIGGAYAGEEPSDDTWLVSTGDEPVGTVVEGSCESEVATSSSATENDFMFVYAIIVFMLGFMFWGFVTNNLMDKNKNEY